VLRHVLAILVALSVAFANGVCPCGLAFVVKGVAAWHGATAEGRVVHRACPACQREGRNPDSDSGQKPNVEQCALMVSGDVPTTSSAAIPALDVVPVFFSFPVADASVPFHAFDRVGFLHSWLSPPTLLNLACCLNT
jgi:hypothetical protein